MEQPRFKMVVALDDSARAEAVLEMAFDQALHHAHSDIYLVTVARDTEEATLAAAERLRELAQSKLDALPAMADPSARHRVRLQVRHGDAAKAIETLVLEVQPALLVLGATSSGGERPHLGPIADHVLARVPCPILAVRVPEYRALEGCPACLRARQSSDGEQWFCQSHHAQGTLTATILGTSATV